MTNPIPDDDIKPIAETDVTTMPPAPSQTATELPSGMNTGQGADDDPPLSIADKHDGEPGIDPDGDGILSLNEANVLLGGEEGTTEESVASDHSDDT